MTRIILLLLGFLGGVVVGAGAAFGAFELVHPVGRGNPLNVEEPLGGVPERTNRRLDWLIGGAVVGGLAGLAGAYLSGRPEEPPRPPADFKIGDPPPDLK
jgi:hypothetical protein